MNNRHLMSFLFLVLAPALALPAQTRREVPERATERIQREVRHEILMLPYYGVFDNISYKVEGYNVTLMGQVVRPTLKTDVARVVKGL